MVEFSSQQSLFPVGDSKTIHLRPYQRDALAGIKMRLDASGKTLGILATGTGKTEIAAELIRECSKGALFIAPLIQLVGQTAQRLRSRGIECGVEQGGLRSDEKVTVACYQSLLSRKRWERYIDAVDLIVVDEVHTNFSKRALEMLTNLTQGGVRLVGLTASPERVKGDPLTSFYGDIGFYYPISQATQDGWLVPSKVWLSVIESMDLSGARMRGQRFGDFNADELARIMAQEQTVQEIGSLVEQHHEGEPSVVFCQGIFQAEALRDNLQRRGLASAIVHSQMEDIERRAHLNDFEDGTVNIVLNVGCLTLGWDWPPVRKLFIAKPTKSKAKYVQMFGRGTRPLPGVVDGYGSAEQRQAAIANSEKPYFEVFDITDSSRHNDLCTSLDVLYPGLDSTLMRRVRKQQEQSGPQTRGTLDPIIEAERAAEAREQHAREQLEWHRRQGLVMRAHYGNYERDIYQGSEQYEQPKLRTHMPFGKYKRQRIKDIPTPYLYWLLNKSECRDRSILDACAEEIANRYCHTNGKTRHWRGKK
jgi:superfamily II DNA or RNA helicase